MHNNVSFSSSLDIIIGCFQHIILVIKSTLSCIQKKSSILACNFTQMFILHSFRAFLRSKDLGINEIS